MTAFSRRGFMAALSGLGLAAGVFAGKKKDEEEKDFWKDLGGFQKIAQKAERLGIPTTELKDLKNGYVSTQAGYNKLVLAGLIRAEFIRVIKNEKCETRCVVTWFPPRDIVFGNVEDHVRVCCELADSDFDKIITDSDAVAFLDSTVKEYGTGS